MIGGMIGGAMGGVIAVARNVAIELTKVGTKVVSKVVKKSVVVGKKTAELGKLQLKKIGIENKIKEMKYNIGRVIYDNNIVIDNKDINSELNRINRCIEEIKSLEEEYSLNGGNVEEIEKEIQLYNQQFSMTQKEKMEVIDYIEKTKNDVSESIGTRHQEAGKYIREVANETKDLDEKINTDKLLADLDEI